MELVDVNDPDDVAETERRVRRRCTVDLGGQGAAEAAPESLPVRPAPESAAPPLPSPCRRRQVDPMDTEAVSMQHMPVHFQSPLSTGSTFRILCYGDSLTAGYCSRGRTFEPYGRSLCKSLGRVGVASSVSVCGLVGKTAQHLAEGLRLPVLRDVVEHQGAGLCRLLEAESPNLVLIMAGTNDLSRGQSPEAVLSSIQKLHAACQARQIPTIALIPPVKIRGAVRTLQQRLAALLIEWSKGTSALAGLFDVEKMVPRKPSGHYWDSDELHMSVAGQRTLGERLGERLACLPLLAGLAEKSKEQKVALAPESTSCARTLTGFFASKKAGGDSSIPTDFVIADEAEAAPLKACREIEEAPRVPACSTPATTASKGKTALPDFGASSACSGLKGPENLSKVLQTLSEKLAQHVSTANVEQGHYALTISLSMLSEKLGGWTGTLDLKADMPGLQGSAILQKLQLLAERANRSLALGVAGARGGGDGSRWGDVDHVMTRLHVQRVS